MAISNESVIYLGEVINIMDTSSGMITRSQTRRSFKSAIPVATIDLTRDQPGTSRATYNRQPAKVTDGKKLTVVPTKRKPKDKNRENHCPGPECPVCLEPLVNLQLRAARCGHIFCADCIKAITAQMFPKCPKCRKFIIKNRIIPVYF